MTGAVTGVGTDVGGGAASVGGAVSVGGAAGAGESDRIADTDASAEVLAREVAFASGRVISVRVDRVRLHGGDVVTRDVIVHPGAVGVVALNDRDEVLLVHQYRHPVQRRLWEPPAGLLDVAGEDPLAAAHRELYEEAHLVADTWAVLLDVHTSPGMTDESLRVYLARDVRDAARERHDAHSEERDMPTRWVPLDDAVTALLDGRLHNPVAAMGLLAADRARRDGFSSLRPADAPWADRPRRDG